MQSEISVYHWWEVFLPFPSQNISTALHSSVCFINAGLSIFTPKLKSDERPAFISSTGFQPMGQCLLSCKGTATAESDRLSVNWYADFLLLVSHHTLFAWLANCCHQVCLTTDMRKMFTPKWERMSIVFIAKQLLDAKVGSDISDSWY